MSLKQIIRRSQIFNPVVGNALDMPGEPMIYSVKFAVGRRVRGVQFFRNMKWQSMLKTIFRTFNRSTTPLVLILKFFVSPPKHIKIPMAVLRKEATPAVMSYELCDYTLSFLEMLHHVLLNSYRQVVKLDTVKMYSNNPRTVMQFMKWDEYVELQNYNTIHTKTESIRRDDKGSMVQSKRKRNEASNRPCKQSTTQQANASVEGSASGDSALCVTCTAKPTKRKKRSAKLPTSHQEAGRRQPGKVP